MADATSSPIWNWFANTAGPWFAGWFTKFLDYLKYQWSILKFMWALVAGFFSVLIWAVTSIADSLAAIDFTHITGPTADTVVYYRFIDRFVPLHEAMALMVIYSSIWTAMICIRWIKQFVPTLSN